MRRFAFLFLAAFAFVSQTVQAAPAVQPVTGSNVAVEGDYRLGKGDVIRVEVHDEPDLTLETELPLTGTVNYPFLGQIQAAGLTVAQLQQRITDGLRGDYLVRPLVRVRVVQYRPFFAGGQVTRPGGYPYVLGLTVEKAVTIAGGFTDRASRSKIFLIKENTGQGNKVKVDLDSPVAPGDTIVVEESLF